MTWLARRRVPLGFACAAAAVWLARPTPRSLAIGSAIAVAGELLRIWAAGHLEKGREVTVSGPYRFTRHPLYARLVAHRPRHRRCVASVAVAAAHVVLSGADALRGDHHGGAPPDGEVRRGVSGLSPRRARRVWRGASASRAPCAIASTARWAGSSSRLRCSRGPPYNRVFGWVAEGPDWRASDARVSERSGQPHRSASCEDRREGGRLAQLVEHRLYTPAVTGSSPVPPTTHGLTIADCRLTICDWRLRIED